MLTHYSLFESYMYRCILYTTSIICDIFVTLSNNINNTNYSILTDNLGYQDVLHEYLINKLKDS